MRFLRILEAVTFKSPAEHFKNVYRATNVLGNVEAAAREQEKCFAIE
jgi:hypothetical protein